ncbi:putative 5'3'-deoxyribonucleotidase protein [Rhizobium phage RHph_I1_18]|nr:putative 5'3'-deoxyribonucleotidase protein [Rhizobium phage RHph_I1_18]
MQVRILSEAPISPRENMTKRTIFLDLDGVCADFDAYYLHLFGAPAASHSDPVLWKNINDYGTFFRDLPVMTGALAFYTNLRELDYEPIVLTACPKTNYADAARQKRAWAREHIDEGIFVLPVLGGKNKALFMHRPGDVLVDDFQKNIDAWIAEGGVGITHIDFPTTMRKIAGYL